MFLKSLINALRVGASVQHEKGTKWAGFVAMAAIFGLSVAQANGILSDVPEKAFVDFVVFTVESVLAIIAAYSQLASTKKIGILPEKPNVLGSDFPDNLRADRLRTESLPSGSDATEKRNSAEFPEGPFWGDT